MQANIAESGKKIQLLYVLWVLENFSDKDNTLKQDDIVEILQKKGYYTERKSVARDLKLLLDFGYKVHGIEPELDEDGNELPLKRGAIWLEREISDEKLSWLMNSIKYNAFMDESQKKDFIESLISLGSKTFKEKNNSSTIIDGGRIFHVEGTSLFKQLSEIDKAIALGKKIRFTYSKIKRDGNKFVYEAGKEYTVSPYWVIVNKGNTYLVCFNHGEDKIWHARVDKIKDVKMINSCALPRTETELKGIDVGEYVTKHPLMFSGDNISIELKIDKNQIGRLIEAFGTNFTTLKETEDYLTVKVYAGELDMFHWAIQYGSFVEILSPQSLRDKIRYHIEGMAFNYQCGEGDRYTQMVKKAKYNGMLYLEGIDLNKNKNKHCDLKNVSVVYLSDNNLTDISFLKNYHRLRKVVIKNNPISNLSVLGEIKTLYDVELVNLPNVNNLDFLRNLERVTDLRIDLSKKVDASAINDMKSLKHLGISDSFCYNESLKFESIEKNNSNIEVKYFNIEKKTPEINSRRHLVDRYPYNILKIMFGFAKEYNADVKELYAEVDKVIERLPEDEKQAVNAIYKEGKLWNVILEELNLSDEELQRRRMSALKKLNHESYTASLEKYVMEEDFRKNHSVAEVVKKIKDLDKIEKNSKK